MRDRASSRRGFKYAKKWHGMSPFHDYELFLTGLCPVLGFYLEISPACSGEMGR